LKNLEKIVGITPTANRNQYKHKGKNINYEQAVELSKKHAETVKKDI